MLIIEIGKKENIERALKRYKNKVYKTKQLNKLREEKEYTKKSTKKRKEKQKAIYVQKIKDSEI
jgi:small subunit ribosomal protein S21|tara:strand:+ start:1571 stop:1762 length:192 start_codon:yes stop_codon:yes gene_type:complete